MIDLVGADSRAAGEDERAKLAELRRYRDHVIGGERDAAIKVLAARFAECTASQLRFLPAEALHKAFSRALGFLEETHYGRFRPEWITQPHNLLATAFAVQILKQR